MDVFLSDGSENAFGNSPLVVFFTPQEDVLNTVLAECGTWYKRDPHTHVLSVLFACEVLWKRRDAVRVWGILCVLVWHPDA